MSRIARMSGVRWMAWLCAVGGLQLGAALWEGDVVARGRGVEIRRGELDQLVSEQKVLFESRGQKLSREQEAQMERQTLERLIMQRVLLLRATEEDRREARILVDKAVAERKAAQGEAAYRRQWLALGVSPDVFEERLMKQAVADQVVYRELRPKVTVTEEAVRAFYDEGEDVATRELRGVIETLSKDKKDTVFYRDATNRLALILQTNLQRLERPAEARARILTLFTVNTATGQPLPDRDVAARRERMDALRKRALAGEDLGKLAQEYSEEDDAVKNRGEYVARRDAVNPQLRQALFEGPTNVVSEVVAAPKGLYLVQVLSRTEGGKVSYEEARNELREALFRQGIEKLVPDWIAGLRKELGVEVVGLVQPSGPP